MVDVLVLVGLAAVIVGLFLTLTVGVALILSGLVVVGAAFAVHNAAASSPPST